MTFERNTVNISFGAHAIKINNLSLAKTVSLHFLEITIKKPYHFVAKHQIQILRFLRRSLELSTALQFCVFYCNSPCIYQIV